jgi:hypothetical protein
MASYERLRVKLKVDLTHYNALWTAGQLGWTIPDKKFTVHGASDRFTAVEFDNGSSGAELEAFLNLLEGRRLRFISVGDNLDLNGGFELRSLENGGAA